MPNTKIHPIRRLSVAWGLRFTQQLCVGVARAYQWRLAGQGEAQQEIHRTVLASVYTHGVLRGMSQGARLAVSDIHAALQHSDDRPAWSGWLSLLMLASYTLGTMLGRASEREVM